jgi:hypothetical protein
MNAINIFNGSTDIEQLKHYRDRRLRDVMISCPWETVTYILFGSSPVSALSVNSDVAYLSSSFSRHSSAFFSFCTSQRL